MKSQNKNKVKRLLRGSQPHLVLPAIKYIEENIDKTSIVFEYGSGKSTGWFAKKVKKLVSVESNPQFYVEVKKELEKAKLMNKVDLHLIQLPRASKECKDYINVINEYPINSFDLILIDGITHSRFKSIIKVIPYLKPGGLLVIDDMNNPISCSWAARYASRINKLLVGWDKQVFYSKKRFKKYGLIEKGTHIYLKPEVKKELNSALDLTATPWLVDKAIDYLERVLAPSTLVFEWGAGKSTIWFSQKVAKVVSIEHSKAWCEKVMSCANKFSLSNIALYHIPKVDSIYFNIINKFPDESFDIILVDGRKRNACLNVSAKKLKSTGRLILDNGERFDKQKLKQKFKGWKFLTFKDKWITYIITKP